MNTPTAPGKSVPSRQRLMATTPMRDWIRGRLTGRLDYPRLIEEAAFPVELAGLITDVIQRTRLWRLEKAEVARELIAHFRDGLAGGADPSKLIADFGATAQAAKLIRRAKKRNRPWAWRAMIKTRNACALLIVGLVALYGLLALRYFTGRPTIARDFLAELNAPALAVPEHDRAWPLYREAFFKLAPRPEGIDMVDGTYAAIPNGDPRKEVYASYLRASGPALDQLALAVQKPHFGYIMTYTPDDEFDAHLARVWNVPVATVRISVEPPQLLEVLVPSISRLRSFARLAHADAELAASDGDRERVLRDLRIQLGMAGHAFDNPLLISQLVGVSMISYASETIDILLRDHPELLTEEDLAEVAHRLATVYPGRVRITFQGEQAMFDDAIQRMYTDNGRGDGRLAAASVRDLRSVMTSALYPWPDDAQTRTAAGPLVMTVSAGRAELSRVFRSTIAAATTFAQTPVWERTNSPIMDSIMKFERDAIARARYWPVFALLPALDHIQSRADNASQQRDATLTSLAIEIYRRRYGRLPAALADLTPALLPAIPADQFDGNPLRYLPAGDNYVLYSIGVDRKDDQGRAPTGYNHNVSGWMPPDRVKVVMNDPAQSSRYDGDWILFPPVTYTVEPLPEPKKSPPPS